MSDYYNSIAKGYDELHGEEQLLKLELIGREIVSDTALKDFIKPNYSLLDVGCGSGISTGFFKVKSKTGIDPSKELIRIAVRNFPLINFRFGKAEKLPFKNNNFDIVISLTAIQNFTSVEKGLDEIKRTGKNHFVLSFLKKSNKRAEIENLIKEKFKIVKRVEEEKDIIYFCK